MANRLQHTAASTSPDSSSGILNRWATPITALLVAILAAVAYRDFLLLNRVFLFTDVGADTVNGFYPIYTHWSDILRSGHIPGWSHQMGLGRDVYPNSLGNPFTLLLLALGRDGMPYGFAYVEVLKLILAGAFFCTVLRHLRVAPLAAVAGGTMYAFSSFMVLGGTWYTFSTEGVYLAMLLLGVERYMQRGRWGLLVFTFFLIGAGRPFNLISNGLFLAMYATLRYADTGGGAGVWAVASAHARRYLPFLAQLTGLALVGAAISGVFLVPTLDQLFHSHRSGSGGEWMARAGQALVGMFATGDELNLRTTLTRLFGNDLLGRGSGFTGWSEYLDAPMLYMGLPTLLLAPQAFVGACRRRRWVLLGAVVLAVGMLIFPFPRQAIWLFSADYYRIVGFMIALVPVFLAVAGLSRIIRTGRVHMPLLAATLVVLLTLLWLPWSPEGVRVDVGAQLTVAGLWVAYALALAVAVPRRWWRGLVAVCLVLWSIEVLWVATPAATARPVLTATDLTNQTGYGDAGADAAAWLRNHDATFYRVAKTFSSSPTDYWIYRNDALMQGYRGTAEYESFANPAYIRFLLGVGTTEMLQESDFRALIGLAHRPVLHPVIGVRYLFSRARDVAQLAAQIHPQQPGLVRAMYTPLTRVGDVSVFRNRWALPLAFTYDRHVSAATFMGLAREARESVLYHAFVAPPGNAEVIDGFASLDLSQPLPSLPTALAARAKGGLMVTDFDGGRIRGTVHVEGRRMLVFSIPADHGWVARVDGISTPLHPVTFGFLGLVLEAGEHRVELTYHRPGIPLGGALSLTGLAILGGMIFRGRRDSGRSGPSLPA